MIYQAPEINQELATQGVCRFSRLDVQLKVHCSVVSFTCVKRYLIMSFCLFGSVVKTELIPGLSVSPMLALVQTGRERSLLKPPRCNHIRSRLLPDQTRNQHDNLTIFSCHSPNYLLLTTESSLAVASVS